MELLLVMGILALVGGIAWPLISQAYVNIKLRNAAEQIQAVWGKARVDAISSGLPHVFRFEKERGDYSVVSWQDENAALEAATPMAQNNFVPGMAMSPPVMPSPAPGTAGAVTNYGGAATTQGPKLPEGMIFTNIDRTSDTRAMAADAQFSSIGITSTSIPVVFYPDGTASDAVLTITNSKGRYITLNLRGLTGITRVGEITLGPEIASQAGLPAGVSP